MKRFLSLILAVIMVLSVASLPAFAAEENFTVDGTTIRIFNQAGWDEAFTTYNIAGYTIYVECDIEITARISKLNASLIGKKGNNNEKPVITLKGCAWFQKFDVDNIIFSNFIIKSDDELIFKNSGYQGVIAQSIQNKKGVVISNIINYVSAKVTSDVVTSIGMIGASNNSDVKIINCVNNGNFTNVKDAESTTDGSYAGGILGALGSNSDTPIITDCFNNGNISAGTAVGGIVGGSMKPDNKLTIQNCENNGDITGTNTNTFTGGILGVSSNTATVKKCKNKGKIEGRRYTGGIVGGYTYGIVDDYKDATDNVLTVESCVNIGSVDITDKFAGGIIGAHNGTANITKCANLGDVSADGSAGLAGGLAGAFNGTINQSYNEGNITAPANVGGLIGGRNNNDDLANPNITIKNSYNKGKVEATTSYAGGIAYYVGNNKVEGELVQKLTGVYNIGEVISYNPLYAFPIARAASHGSTGSVTVQDVYALEKGSIKDLAYNENIDACETLIEYSALINENKDGSALPDGFETKYWVACEDGYPILKNNLPKNADGTDKEYYKVTLANGENGVALKEEVTYVEKGTDKTYTLKINPNEGYKVESVTADGVACEGINNVYEIVISDDAEVSVVYALIPVEEGTTSASQLFTTVDAETFEVYAFASFGVVTGNEAVDFGMLLSFEETDDFTLDNTSLRKFSANIGENVKGANEKGQYGIKLYGNLITNGKTYYCVPYVEYADGTVCYGSVMTIK